MRKISPPSSLDGNEGGLSTGPLDPSLKLPVDKAEERPTRESWGPVLVRPEEKPKMLTSSKEERFKEIEYAMAFGDAEDVRFEEVSEVTDRYNPNQKVTIRKPIQREITVEPDGEGHSYQICGTWSGRRPEAMSEAEGVAWSFELTLGENRWESFYLIQDHDPERRIVPNVPKATKEAVPVGPLAGPKHARATKSGKWMYWGDEASQTEQANRELISQASFGRSLVPKDENGKLAYSGLQDDDCRLPEALVWVDCEMTGLGEEGGPGQHTLLEVAVLITNDQLELVAEGPDLVIHQPDEVLDGMNDWCKKQFGWDAQAKSATPNLLADQVRRSATRLEEVDGILHDFVTRHVVDGGGILAGNTVHMDKRFLDKYCPKFVSALHYRIVDVSTVKELCRRWNPEHYRRAPRKKGSHRAMEDIQESLKDGGKHFDVCALHAGALAVARTPIRLRFLGTYRAFADPERGEPADPERECSARCERINEWLLDCRARVNVPENQVGMPGQKYLVTFRWEKFKEITWEKMEEKGEFVPGTYYLTGPFNGWNFVEMEIDSSGPRRRRKGWFSAEVQVSSLPMEFCVVRNQDFRQAIYPEVPPGTAKASQHSAICGPDEGDNTWQIEDLRGSTYKISFYRDPEDCEPSSMRIDWKKVEEERPYVEPEVAYYINSQCNDFNHKLASRMTLEADGDRKLYVGEVMIQDLPLDPKRPTERQPMMRFNVLIHRLKDHCIHPDQENCTQESEHMVLLDDGKNCWCIGPDDALEKGDRFTVRLVVQGDTHNVSWSKVPVES
ncbi:Oligoribonuclease [Durusdinium trenchii]|uniref:Mitochondrial (RNA exonuclease 2 homolog) (Small nuclease) n=1 Tax=Durusdinium trenchii TaxID=1381693 RepID=A0ABP0QH81_9DINO